MLKAGPEKMMRAVRALGILALLLAAGCADVKQSAPGAMAQTGTRAIDPSPTGANQGGTTAAEMSQSVPKKDATVALAQPVAPRQPEMTGIEVNSIESKAAAPALPPSRSPSSAKAAPPLVKAPAIASAPQPTVEQPRKNEASPPVARNPEPTLDVAGLTARLRDTKAIGVFTKLALKNQVDDLLKQFRARHQNGQQGGVASLRQPYDMLVLKVLSVVQDNDPSLARAISDSREAIWGILADPQKFNLIA